MLMGVSEGGVAAALYRGDEFRARVIAQWTCHGRPFVRGLAAGSGEAILSVVHRNDPWYDEERTDGQQGDCGSFLDERALGESIVLDGQAEHDVFSDISVMQKVTQFLYASMN